MTRTCRVCGEPRASYTKMALCREHYQARRRVKGPHGKPGRVKVEVCRECGGPRKANCQKPLCEEHYRVYVIRASRKRRGTDADAPVKDAQVKVADTSKCRLCDEPRLPYGAMCRQCLRNYEAERRRKAGAQPRSTTCKAPACGVPKATPAGRPPCPVAGSARRWSWARRCLRPSSR